MFTNSIFRLASLAASFVLVVAAALPALETAARIVA
jgi:hypothetical protein